MFLPEILRTYNVKQCPRPRPRNIHILRKLLPAQCIHITKDHHLGIQSLKALYRRINRALLIRDKAIL